MVSAGGTVLTTIGNVKTNIKLGGCSLPIKFFVVDILTQDVILSAEFFKCMGVLIDYKRKCLSLYNESINMRGGSHRMHWKYNYMPRLYQKSIRTRTRPTITISVLCACNPPGLPATLQILPGVSVGPHPYCWGAGAGLWWVQRLTKCP